MRKVVIYALDLNVLSSYSLHEQRRKTRLGTLKVSRLYHKKVKCPLNFFCSTLLGYVPGGAPFSQQSQRNYRNVQWAIEQVTGR